MGRHSQWRKIAKRERRRRFRIQEALERDGTTACDSVDYQDWLKEQEVLEMVELNHIEQVNNEENEKWLKAERIAMEQWQRLQEHKEKIKLQHLEEEAKRRLEWELEEERKRKEKQRLQEIQEENRKKQEIFMKHLENFLSGDSDDPPDELLVSRATKPECDLCPFFSKTGCCRFGDQCSRNHRYPGISKLLLATNFFSHFGLENADEHDADIMLEYEDSDTYKEFHDFFNDVLPEFEKFGRITQFKICNNYEKHLRGNTYIEFAELRCAVAAYRALHSRWYGGKQLSLQFCLISSWKSAICGLQSRKRCPKGRACNFLHVFRNPNNLFNSISKNHDNSERTLPRSWRWSESPEVDISRRRSRSSERKYRYHEIRISRRTRRRERDRQERSNREENRSDRRGHSRHQRKDKREERREHDRTSREEDKRDESRKERRIRHTEDKYEKDQTDFIPKRQKPSEIRSNRGSS